jgi:hypothetical protein
MSSDDAAMADSLFHWIRWILFWRCNDENSMKDIACRIPGDNLCNYFLVSGGLGYQLK